MTPPFDYKQASDASERQLANPLVEDAFPYRVYSAVHDDRTSKSHRVMECLGIGGTAVYHRDDPVWKMFRPPWGARHCRCTWWGTTVEQAAARGVEEAKQWMKTGVEPRHEFVASPALSTDSLCEPGILYVWDYPLILDDFRSGVDFRAARAMKDIRSLVTCEKNLRPLRDSLMTVPELIGMADALMKVDTNALAAWPALISCFVSRMSQRRQEETVSWRALIYDAMRQVLHSGDVTERELILPIWIASDDANSQMLVEILGCRHWDVRKAAAERLGQLGREGAGTIAHLELLLSDRSKYVRAAAADAINRIRSV
jgi:hypothetical protein